MLKRGLSEEHPVLDSRSVAAAAPDTLNFQAATPQREDLDTTPLNSSDLNRPQLQSLDQGPQLSDPACADLLEDKLQSRLSQSVSNSKDNSSSDEESKRWFTDKQMDCESAKSRPKDTDRQRNRESEKREKGSEAKEQGSVKQVKSPSWEEEEGVWERHLERGGPSLEENVSEQDQRREEKRQMKGQSKKQHSRDVEKDAGQRSDTRSGSNVSSPAVTPSSQEGELANNQVRRSDIYCVFILSLNQHLYIPPVLCSVQFFCALFSLVCVSDCVHCCVHVSV